MQSRGYFNALGKAPYTGRMEFERLDHLRNPVGLVAFSGWNDAGNAASDAALHLIDRYPSQEITRIDAERYFDFQATRPITQRTPDGPWLKWPHITIQLVELPDRDLIVALGPEPSLLWRSFSRELVTSLLKYEPKLVVLLGAMLSDTPHSRPLPVSTSSYDPVLRQQFGLEEGNYEGPTGIVGVLHQELISRSVPTASIWVAIPHYVSSPPNPKGQHALLNRVETLIGEELDCAELPAEADKWTQAVDMLSQEDPDVADYIEQLEEERDAEEVEGISGDSIAAELENFLKGQGEAN